MIRLKRLLKLLEKLPQQSREEMGAYTYLPWANQSIFIQETDIWEIPAKKKQRANEIPLSDLKIEEMRGYFQPDV